MDVRVQTNPFPAILLAGPPHIGKSVLSFLLTGHLRQMRTPHILLRAIPDNEGDWPMSSDQHLIYTLRFKHKGKLSASFLAHLRQMIDRRSLPLLVDLDGALHKDHFELIEACSHSILLYNETEDCAKWQRDLAQAGLLPIAELQSQQGADDQILNLRPVLEGIISNLERGLKHQKVGATFGVLLDRVAGICHFTDPELEHFRLSNIPKDS